MKRLLLLAGVCLSLVAGRASGDYIIIKVDLNQLGQNKGPQGPPGGVTGVPPGGGATGFPPGGATGVPPGTNVGVPPGGPGGFKGGFGGAAGGPPPGFGAAGGGQQTGMPPTGTTGFFGGPTASTDPAKSLPPLWAYAYLELKSAPTVKPIDRNTFAYWIDHKIGKGYVPKNYAASINAPSLGKQLADKRRALKEPKTAEQLVQVAAWALQHGLLADFVKTMKEAAEVDASHPMVASFTKVHGLLSKAPTKDDPSAASLLADLNPAGGSYRVHQSDGGHYTLLSKLLKDDAAVQHRLARLEETYQSFFYWFALKGKILPIPNYRLVAVLEKDGMEFARTHVSFNSVPMVADGFTARRDNVIILSAKRLDEAYRTLEKSNAQHWQDLKIVPSELLSEAILKKKLRLSNSDLATLQTLALVQKAMEDESERATTTHEGIRQLLAATGLLPRSVAGAEWVRFGIASFFETGREAFYGGPGLPSWHYLISFKHLRKAEKLPDDKGADIVTNVITDGYFRRAYAAQERLGANKDDKHHQEAVHQELDLARTTAWGLTYYLMNHKLDNLLDYLGELRNLPRDVEYDGRVMQGCFNRAMGPSSDNGRLAVACFEFLGSTLIDIDAFEQHALQSRAKD